MGPIERRRGPIESSLHWVSAMSLQHDMSLAPLLLYDVGYEVRRFVQGSYWSIHPTELRHPILTATEEGWLPDLVSEAIEAAEALGL